MIRALFSLLGLSTLMLPTPYVEDYYYVPRPAVADLSPAITQPATTQPVAAPPVVTTFISVIGIERANSEQQIPDSIHLRIRVENRDAPAAVFEPQSLELMNGDLLMFPTPLVPPPQPVTLTPGQSTILDAWFPFPPGSSWDNTELQSLHLRSIVQIGGQRVAKSTTFHRVLRYYWRRRYWRRYYWDNPMYDDWDGGVVIIRR